MAALGFRIDRGEELIVDADLDADGAAARRQ